MSTTQITYIIPGNPISWKRAGHCAGGFYDAQKMNKLATGLHISNQHDGILFKGPLILDITFYFPMPVSLKKKWDDMRGKQHHFRPDLDNLLKYYLDVSSGLLFEDDCQISEIKARKVYGDVGRTEFTITEIKI